MSFPISDKETSELLKPIVLSMIKDNIAEIAAIPSTCMLLMTLPENQHYRMKNKRMKVLFIAMTR